MWFNVGCWKYYIKREQDSHFSVVHCVTPADGGYGAPVDMDLEADYFSTHTVEQLYHSILPLQLIPIYYNDDVAFKEMEDIRKELYTQTSHMNKCLCTLKIQ
jgi:hypothetical protein